MLEIALEVVIDVMPLVVLAIALKSRHILKTVQLFDLVPIDMVQPFLWLVIHYNSKQIFHYSLLPVVGVVFGIVGVIYIIRSYFKATRRINSQKMFRTLSNVSFIFSTIFAVLLIIWRVVILLIA